MDADLVTSVKLGWLWFDDDPKTSLEEKVRRASSRYREKFGQKPRLCYVNRKTLDGGEPAVGALLMRSAANVSPGYFLFVVDADLLERLAA